MGHAGPGGILAVVRVLGMFGLLGMRHAVMTRRRAQLRSWDRSVLRRRSNHSGHGLDDWLLNLCPILGLHPFLCGKLCLRCIQCHRWVRWLGRSLLLLLLLLGCLLLLRLVRLRRATSIHYHLRRPLWRPLRRSHHNRGPVLPRGSVHRGPSHRPPVVDHHRGLVHWRRPHGGFGLGHSRLLGGQEAGVRAEASVGSVLAPRGRRTLRTSHHHRSRGGSTLWASHHHRSRGGSTLRAAHYHRSLWGSTLRASHHHRSRRQGSTLRASNHHRPRRQTTPLHHNTPLLHSRATRCHGGRAPGAGPSIIFHHHVATHGGLGLRNRLRLGLGHLLRLRFLLRILFGVVVVTLVELQQSNITNHVSRSWRRSSQVIQCWVEIQGLLPPLR
mmetsp:Transcript_96237/g.220641  ORF Transcript_96237/g.220641 Transcript_96237/m.220641 type:complete len:385 (+) Transcript_96237:1120-2274(+)